MRLRLTLACGDYDRTRALQEGTVRPDGIELTYLRLSPEEIFFRMLRHREFEVAELSLSSYLITLHTPDRPFVALPVFTSRMFRHGSAYIHADSGISSAAELRGRAIGLPEYQLTAGVWLRGILADYHDLPVDAPTYRTGGQETPGRVEKVALTLPSNFSVTPIEPTQTLSELLVTGAISALFTPRIPLPFARGDRRVARLFPDVIAAERAYFARSKIFPIMHVVVVRRDVYEAYPWVAQSLMKAFGAAKAQAAEWLYDSSSLRFMEPWMIQHIEQARDVLGLDYWPYGLPANRHVLETFLRYHHEQGLSPRRLDPEELFAPESLESAII